jgi:hypothetical protein
MDGHRGLTRRGLDEAKELAGRLVDPVVLVVDAEAGSDTPLRRPAVSDHGHGAAHGAMTVVEAMTGAGASRSRR